MSLIVPSNTVTAFSDVADVNTKNRIETIGMLLGRKLADGYEVTDLFVPEQTGTSTSCLATLAGDIALCEFKERKGLSVLGWIHTHPGMDVFMSSVDLHTHYGMQVSEQLAVALVVDPFKSDKAFLSHASATSFTTVSVKVKDISRASGADRGLHNRLLQQCGLEAGHVKLIGKPVSIENQLSVQAERKYLYTRYVDSHKYEGCVEASKEHLESLPGPRNDKHLFWRTMTHQDLDSRAKRYQDGRSKSKKGSHGCGRRWKQVVHTNKNSISNSHEALKSFCYPPNVKLLGSVVCVKKNEHSVKLVAEENGYLQCTGIYEGVFNDQSLHNFVLHGKPSRPLSFEEICDSENIKIPLTFKNQLMVLNSLSNDSKPDGIPSVSFCCYFSTGTCESTDAENGSLTSKYRPTSVRNKVIYFKRHGDVSSIYESLFSKASSKKRTQESSENSNPVETSRTKRHKLDGTEIEPSQENVPDITILGTDDGTSPFSKFCENIVGENGLLKWRIHSPALDVIAMNDVSLESGIFQTNSFVHVSLICSSNFSCTCRMFTISSQMSGTSTDTMTCTHVRFFHEIIMPKYNDLFTDHICSVPHSAVDSKLRAALESINIPVLKIDKDHSHHRFSVLAKDVKSSCFVHLSGNRFSCMDGKCRAGSGHKRKETGLADSPCEHLRVMNDHSELWKPLLDEEDRTTQPSKHFDDETGLWKFPSISSHRPRSMEDRVFKISRDSRRWLTNMTNTDVMFEDGHYSLNGREPLRLAPVLNKEAKCQCGTTYWTDQLTEGILVPRFSHYTSLFTDTGVITCQIMDRDCPQEKAECRIQYSGEQDSIHILSSYTAGGDEIGWNFIHHVTNCQISFTAFCDLTEKNYVDSKFMSRQTFVDFIFSWMYNFKYDFREVCLDCGTNPKILACDGTKIGILFKISNVIPIEQPTCDNSVTVNHTRTDRQFFNYSTKDSKDVKEEKRSAMKDLQYFISLRLSDIGNEDIGSEEKRKANLIKHTPLDCQPLVSRFVDKLYPHEIVTALCPILKVFTTSSPVTSVINYRFLDIFYNILERDDNILESALCQELPEICKLLCLGQELYEMNTIMFYILSKIQNVHSSDSYPENCSVLEKYNPEAQGRAYYFTQHGGRTRELPNYSKTEKNHRSESSCQKRYSDATKGGSTFLFTWLDPLHGHCYGCHIIPNSEGRKDPFSSALLYMETAPSEVFYDFSCQLEEYCLNREPAFWRNCRFYHDIFHGYSHKCSAMYNSRRISTLANTGINSEICEQFNSYIQKLKFSVKAMSQGHFMFFLQFFIREWNMKKREKLLKDKEMVKKIMKS